jgi:hypothetical protein
MIINKQTNITKFAYYMDISELQESGNILLK